MKHLLIVCLGLLASLTEGEEPALQVVDGGWRGLLNEELPALEERPGVKWTVNGEEIVVKVTNPLNEPLTYAGLTAAAPQLYYEELQDGKWVDRNLDWACGNGSGPHLLPAKGAVELRLAPRMKAKDLRIYATFYPTGWKKGSLVMLYTSEKAPDGK
ncbi:MAG: hypothetical protein V4662_02635 [Verrucomicrobiota bacterium]